MDRLLFPSPPVRAVCIVVGVIALALGARVHGQAVARAQSAAGAETGTVHIPYARVIAVESRVVDLRVNSRRLQVHGVTGVVPGDVVSVVARPRAGADRGFDALATHVHRGRAWKWRVGVAVPALLLLWVAWTGRRNSAAADRDA